MTRQVSLEAVGDLWACGEQPLADVAVLRSSVCPGLVGLAEEAGEVVECPVDELVVDPDAALVGGDEPDVGHAFEVVADGGLGQGEPFGEVAHAQFIVGSRAEQGDQSKPGRSAKAEYTLGAFRARDAAPEKVALLGHDQPQVRTAAMEALERLGSLGQEALAQALVDGAETVRPTSGGRAGVDGASESVDALRTGLQDSSWQVRISVLMALADVDDDRAGEAIVATTHDEDRRVRVLATHLGNAR